MKLPICHPHKMLFNGIHSAASQERSVLRLGGLKVQRCLPSFGILKSKYPYCSAASNRTENNKQYRSDLKPSRINKKKFVPVTKLFLGKQREEIPCLAYAFPSEVSYSDNKRLLALASFAPSRANARSVSFAI